VVISGADDGTVRVWDLATGDPVGDPSARHTGPVYTVGAAELQGRPVVISGGGDQSVRVWDIAKRRPLRYHFRRVRLRHAAPVRAAVPMRREDRFNVIAGCRDSVSQTWDLSACRLLSRIITPGRTGVSAIVTLAPDRILYANGGMVSIYKGTNNAAPAPTIDLDSEIHALIAHGASTVVAATRLGLVALRIPY
jgi:WD40 repeat protein